MIGIEPDFCLKIGIKEVVGGEPLPTRSHLKCKLPVEAAEIKVCGALVLFFGG